MTGPRRRASSPLLLACGLFWWACCRTSAPGAGGAFAGGSFASPSSRLVHESGLRLRVAIPDDDFDFGDVPASAKKAAPPPPSELPPVAKVTPIDDDDDDDEEDEARRAERSEFQAGQAVSLGLFFLVLLGGLIFTAVGQQSDVSTPSAKTQKVQAKFDTFFEEGQSKTRVQVDAA
eukprot:CAMPEP_0115501666 /NCGR_PEP_ID=MMETSP0271-20121206/68518_1 /TAXON_ID=71861 /ORGANISM="Scrippsiella trochoidea, Strain CCMP3099" /LENGTH=175 /DNA_ID=CAMNT_0002930613 /DNA_START=1 /DNA_END=528 /DNA_ORIENTATION=+